MLDKACSSGADPWLQHVRDTAYSLFERHLQPQPLPPGSLQPLGRDAGHWGTKPSLHLVQQHDGSVVSLVAAVHLGWMLVGGGHCEGSASP